MFWNRRYVLVFWILFVVLMCQTICGNYDCYKLSSGKDICFMFDGSPQHFEDSELFCQKNGGFLLEIYNEDIQKLVTEFGSKKSMNFVEAWLNLMRSEQNKSVWFWGGEQAGNPISYSNWVNGYPNLNTPGQAIMNSEYKWTNSYTPNKSKTFCIKGNRQSFLNQITGSSSSSIPSSAGMGVVVGVGVGLGGLVLIIVSSLLIAKFVFHKEIPLPFKSSRSRKSPPHETGSDVSKEDPVYDGYEQIDENTIGVIQHSSGPRSGSLYAEVTAIPDPHEPPTYNNNVNNSSNKKVLEYADLGRSSPSNSMQEPERIAAPNGTLYTKTFEKKQNDNLTTD